MTPKNRDAMRSLSLVDLLSMSDAHIESQVSPNQKGDKLLARKCGIYEKEAISKIQTIQRHVKNWLLKR
jgi:hypothetical protein